MLSILHHRLLQGILCAGIGALFCSMNTLSGGDCKASAATLVLPRPFKHDKRTIDTAGVRSTIQGYAETIAAQCRIDLAKDPLSIFFGMLAYLKDQKLYSSLNYDPTDPLYEYGGLVEKEISSYRTGSQEEAFYIPITLLCAHYNALYSKNQGRQDRGKGGPVPDELHDFFQHPSAKEAKQNICSLVQLSLLVPNKERSLFLQQLSSPGSLNGRPFSSVLGEGISIFHTLDPKQKLLAKEPEVIILHQLHKNHENPLLLSVTSHKSGQSVIVDFDLVGYSFYGTAMEENLRFMFKVNDTVWSAYSTLYQRYGSIKAISAQERSLDATYYPSTFIYSRQRSSTKGPSTRLSEELDILKAGLQNLAGQLDGVGQETKQTAYLLALMKQGNQKDLDKSKEAVAAQPFTSTTTVSSSSTTTTTFAPASITTSSPKIAAEEKKASEALAALRAISYGSNSLAEDRDRLDTYQTVDESELSFVALAKGHYACFFRMLAHIAQASPHAAIPSKSSPTTLMDCYWNSLHTGIERYNNKTLSDEHVISSRELFLYYNVLKDYFTAKKVPAKDFFLLPEQSQDTLNRVKYAQLISLLSREQQSEFEKSTVGAKPFKSILGDSTYILNSFNPIGNIDRAREELAAAASAKVMIVYELHKDHQNPLILDLSQHMHDNGIFYLHSYIYYDLGIGNFKLMLRKENTLSEDNEWINFSYISKPDQHKLQNKRFVLDCATKPHCHATTFIYLRAPKRAQPPALLTGTTEIEKLQYDLQKAAHIEQQSIKQCETLSADIRAKSAAIDSLQSELLTVKEKLAQVQKENGKIAILNSRIQELENQLTQSRKNYKEFENQSIANFNAMIREKKKSEDRREKLQAQFQEFQASYSKFSEEFVSLKREFDRIKNENSAIAIRRDTIEREYNVQCTLVTRLQDSLSEKDKALMLIKQETEPIRSLMPKMERLTEELAKEQGTLRLAQAQLEEAQTARAKAQAELAKAQAELEVSQLYLRAKEGQLLALQTKYQEATNLLTATEGRLVQAKKEKDDATSKALSSIKAFETLETTHKKCPKGNEWTSLTAQLAELRQSALDKEATVQGLNDKISSMRGTIAQYEKERETLRGNITNLQSYQQTLTAKITELTGQNQEYQRLQKAAPYPQPPYNPGYLAQATDENELKFTKEIAELQARATELTTNNTRLQAQSTELTKSNTKLKADIANYTKFGLYAGLPLCFSLVSYGGLLFGNYNQNHFTRLSLYGIFSFSTLASLINTYLYYPRPST